MDAALIRSMTDRFSRMMANRAPIVTEPHQHPFYAQIAQLSKHPLRYERPGLLDRALAVIDLEAIYAEADAASEKDDSLGYQDHLIKALMKWFKTTFFKWVNAPECSSCKSETEQLSAGSPTATESVQGASRVELYRCRADSTHIERFPRYDNPETLLTWRKGRCGEWANCFTLLCIALGSQARWIWNAEDHVWTEVYSNTLKRWVHCDSCENAWDEPLIYSVGWGKKMSYCFAFSSQGAQDVTRRYVRQQEHALDRRLAPEIVVETAFRDITAQIRSVMPSDEAHEAEQRDKAEMIELAAYEDELRPTKTGEQRARESGDAQWKHERGEDGPSTKN